MAAPTAKRDYVCCPRTGVQIAMDSKYKLIVDCDTVNDINDQGQLSNMVQKTRQVFRDQKSIIVADTGYDNYLEIINLVDKSTEPLIKPQKGKQDKMGKSIGVTLATTLIFADQKNPARLPKAEGRQSLSTHSERLNVTWAVLGKQLLDNLTYGGVGGRLLK